MGTRSKFWCSLLWQSENQEFGHQIFQTENTGSSIETQRNFSKIEAQENFSKIGLFSWQIILYLLFKLKKISSLTSLGIMLVIHFQFLFHTLFQCNDGRVQDVSLVSHANVFYYVKVQNVKRKVNIYTFQNLLKWVLKNKENAYLAM